MRIAQHWFKPTYTNACTDVLHKWMNWTSIPNPLISHFRMQFEMVFSLYKNISFWNLIYNMYIMLRNKIQFSKCEIVIICDLKLLNINWVHHFQCSWWLHTSLQKKKKPIMTCFQYRPRPYHHTPYTQYYYFAYHLNPRVVAQGYIITLNNHLSFVFLKYYFH